MPAWRNPHSPPRSPCMTELRMTELRMTGLFDNPIGLDGFEFVEFSAPEKGVLEPVFAALGFTKIARHRSKDVELWRRSEEHTSELQSLLRISYAVFCLKKKTKQHIRAT